MTYPIQSGSSIRAAQIGEAANTFSFSELLRSGQTSYCLLFNSTSSIIPPWGKLSNLWTPFVFSLRPRVPSWIWIRWIQYATHRNSFTSPPKLAMSTEMQYIAPIPSYFISGQHFWRYSRFSPKQPEPQTQGWLQRFCSQTANLTFGTSFLPTRLAA